MVTKTQEKSDGEKIMTELLTGKKTIKFSVPGTPQRKKRVRFGQGRAYTHKDTVNYQSLVKLFFQARCPAWKPQAGPVILDTVAYFPVPKSRTKWFKEMCEHNEVPFVKCPDYDNVSKVVADALNEIAYRDDRQIFDGRSREFYSNRPRLNVTLTFYDEIKRPKKVIPSSSATV